MIFLDYYLNIPKNYEDVIQSVDSQKCELAIDKVMKS